MCVASGSASGVEGENKLDPSGAAEPPAPSFRGPPSTGFTMAQVLLHRHDPGQQQQPVTVLMIMIKNNDHKENAYSAPSAMFKWEHVEALYRNTNHTHCEGTETGKGDGMGEEWLVKGVLGNCPVFNGEHPSLAECFTCCLHVLKICIV